jgi:serine/threonine protein kinase/Flp pilus assembly protein TadD
MPLAPGARLGGYEIVSALGAGGMGEVYRARDTRLGRDVAVKVLPADVAGNTDRLVRLEREARTVAAMNHPNIVTLHSIEDAGGLRFLTMELVEGDSLDRHVVAGGLPVARVLDIAIPLADALVAAHERGVVHRDLKPANVMLTRSGRVKVLDFGLARPAETPSALDATQAATMPTPISTVGQVVGTVPYMAPEQVRGETLDARTDLFALGVLLYELLAGRRPFTGATFADISSSILRDAPESLAAVRSDLPPDLVRIVTRCLEKEPRNRLQTALDVYNELQHVRRALELQSVGSAGSGTRSPAASESPSIAILPFVNRGRDEEDEYFADGLADELLTTLAKIRGLRVAARTSSFSFRGKEATIAEIGKTLGVATVLEGSIRKAGSRIRIAVQLVNVADGYHLWTETYDRTLDDIFAVQDDIAQSVVKELRHALLGAEPDSKTSGETKAVVAEAAKGRATDPEAYRLFLQGRFILRRIGEGDVKAGIDYLKSAVERDPDFAAAWSWMARGYVQASGWGIMPVAEASPLARKAALQAIELQPDLADGYMALGMVQSWTEFDWKGARASFEKAVELAPDDAEVLSTAVITDYGVGRLDRCAMLLERAMELDPLNIYAVGFAARVYRAQGRRREAEAAFRRTIELSPTAYNSNLFLGFYAAEDGNFEEAVRLIEKEHSDWALLYGLAIIYWNAGRHEESDEKLRLLIETHSADSAYQIAMVHAAQGRIDKAFEWLNRAYDQRDSGVQVSKVEPLLRPLHADPRWRAYLERVGLAD